MAFTDSIKMVEVAVVDQDLISAKPSDVASGKMFIGTTKHLEGGLLPENPTRQDITLAAGTSLEIPYGINRNNYVVTAEGLEEQTTATALPEHILYPKTAWVNGEKITGSMPNIGQENDEIAAGQSHIINLGYHDGTGVITAKSLAVQTVATAEEFDIISGKTAYVNGEQIEGRMPNNGILTETISAGETYTLPSGYYDEGSTITAKSLENQTEANATSYEILEGFNAWVNGIKINGSMAKNEPTTITLPMNGTYNIPNGYHTGQGKVTQNIQSKGAITAAPTRDPQVFETAGYYMTGNVTVTGVDALSYRRTAAIVKDALGEEITNYSLTVSSGTARIATYVDNWHDNATFNLYLLTFNDLIDANGNPVNLNCTIPIDWTNQTREDYIFGGITISIELETGTNSHLFTISGITSGKITIIDQFDCRLFGVDYE